MLIAGDYFKIPFLYSGEPVVFGKQTGGLGIQ
jgi:hypothetical protein